MAALTDVVMSNNKNGKQFLFRGVLPFHRRRSQPVVNVPLISTTEDNTFLFRFSGQSGIIDFTFAIFDDGTDVSNGTNSPAITSVDAQVLYLFDTFFSESYDTDWTLAQSNFLTAPKSGVITDLNVEPNGKSLRVGTLSFQIGRIGNL